MEIIKTNNLNEARKQIDKSKKEKKDGKIALLSQDDEFNRKALEMKNIDMLIINEDSDIKDYSKQRNSGLNEILAKLASKNKITIGIELEKILKKSDKEKARSLARLAQNIMLCKKAKAELHILNKNLDKRSLLALLLSLGASTFQAQEAIG